MLLVWLLVKAAVLAAAASASDYLVKSLPLYDGSDVPLMHAGKIDVGSALRLGPRNLFFWHVASEAPSDTTIVWLNGGPGCSSMDGGLLEIGPFRVAGDGRLVRSPEGWASFANLLFIDQPFGTGFSDPELVEEHHAFATSLEDAADAVVQFLNEYSFVFPEIRNQTLILAGESFAGQYVPHVYKSLERNRYRVGHFSVQGAILIAPWIDPPHQYISQALYAKLHTLIEPEFFQEVDEHQDKCIESLEAGPRTFENAACEKMNEFIMSASAGGLDIQQCFNVYDTKYTSPFPSCGAEWPKELPLVTKYLSREDVQLALHALEMDGTPPRAWVECNQKVHQAMRTGQVSAEFFGDLLDDIPVMVIAGDDDWVCNYIGLEQFFMNLKWLGIVGFEDPPTPTTYGHIQHSRGLTYARVAKGSHMLPVDHLPLTAELAKKLLEESVRNMRKQERKKQFSASAAAAAPKATGESYKGGEAPPKGGKAKASATSTASATATASATSAISGAKGATDASTAAKTPEAAYGNRGLRLLMVVASSALLLLYMYYIVDSRTRPLVARSPEGVPLRDLSYEV